MNRHNGMETVNSIENSSGEDFGVEYMVWSTRTSPDQQRVGDVADQLELLQVEAPGSPFQMPEEVIDEVEPLSSGFNDRLDADHDDAPLRLRSMESILGGVAAPGRVVINLEQGEIHAVSAEELASFGEAKQEPCWTVAMREEIKAIEDNNTWVLTELPAGARAISLKWVFKVKKNEQGNVLRHKARLVVKGYAQR
jgi:hypothetical protein